MALFQTTKPHEDRQPRRALTQADTAFLDQLQTVLNTQDNMCTRQPLYWGILQSHISPCAPNRSEFATILDRADCTEYTDPDELRASLKSEEPALPVTNDLEDLCEALNDIWPDRFEIFHYRHETELVKNVLFLTHDACEAHLRKYEYNYEPDAHAYAMSAQRCPEFERLLEILQSVDWQNISAK